MQEDGLGVVRDGCGHHGRHEPDQLHSTGNTLASTHNKMLACLKHEQNTLTPKLYRLHQLHIQDVALYIRHACSCTATQVLANTYSPAGCCCCWLRSLSSESVAPS